MTNVSTSTSIEATHPIHRPFPLRFLIIFLFVFLSGFANLATQIIGPRMFSSFLGADTVVWACMISVTLVGLAVGYLVGGRFPLAKAKQYIPVILASNALYLAVISGLVWQIPPAVGNYGILSVVLITFTVFFIPATLFGTISPLSITLLSELVDRKHMSKITGSVYGVGTIGNVLGALTAAFILIPSVGLTFSLQVFAILLVVFALYFWLTFRSSRTENSSQNQNIHQAESDVQGKDLPRDARSLLLLGLVLFSGFASLATEIIGPRMFTSLFGPTTILWAIMISVTLLGLSIGYFIGGSIPLRIARFALPIVISLNAILLLLASWIIWELPASLGAGNVETVVLTAISAFLLPSILFGIDSQLIISLLSEGKSKQVVSRIVGIVFGLSTIGSVFGALASALILMPTIGFSVSLQLFSLGFILFSFLLFSGLWRTITILSLAFFFLFPQPNWHWEDGGGTLLIQKEGYYQTIRIYTDNSTYVRLHLGPTYESEMDLNTLEPRFGYARNMVEATGDVQGKRVLVIGGAGHSMARALEARGANVTEVEIDPIVVQLSNEFFGPIEGEVIVQDGRAYVEQAETGIFDFVLIDAFNGPQSIPAQLTTVEFFESVERILKPDGIMIMNFIGNTSGPRSGSFRAMAATISTAFTDARYWGGGNILFIASASDFGQVELPEAPSDSQILTDDLNPIEILLEEARGGFRYRR